MRYRRLTYFVAVAEELSFTRAAERLHMAQPPLSQQIALLEKDIGVTLVRPVPPHDPPDRGRSRPAARARGLLADLDETTRMVRRVAEGAVGRLTIGFVPSAVNGPLPALLRRFRSGHAEVELTLREMAPDALLRAVREHRLDLAVLYLPIGAPDLAVHRLATEELLLALPRDHPMAQAGTLALDDVEGEPFVLPEQHDVPGLHAAVTALFADAGIAPRVAQRGVWLIQTVLGLVAAGIGLAVVPSSVAAMAHSGVTLRPIRSAAHRVELAAVWRPDHHGAARCSRHRQ